MFCFNSEIQADEMEISETHSDYTGYGVRNGATDGSIDVTVTGGTGVYTYTWSQDGMMPVLWPSLVIRESKY